MVGDVVGDPLGLDVGLVVGLPVGDTVGATVGSTRETIAHPRIDGSRSGAVLQKSLTIAMHGGCAASCGVAHMGSWHGDRAPFPNSLVQLRAKGASRRSPMVRHP